MKSKKVRRELWMVLVAVVVVSAAVLAWDSPSETVLDTSAVVPTPKAAETKHTSAPSTPTASGVASVPTAGVVTIANTIADASTFNALLASSGVASGLNVNGTYTLFVPTNAAMRSASSIIENMSAAEKKRFLQYHLIADRAVDTDAMTAGYVNTVSRDPLNFTVIGDQKLVRVNSSKILATYTGKNGVVYVIDAPLLPPHKTQ